MAIVIRIVSADGKRTTIKSLPGLPARLKVPSGAKVDVTEDGVTMSLAQYVNEHANREHPDKVIDSQRVVIDSVDNWEDAETWLNSLTPPSDKESSNAWFSTADDPRGSNVMGLGVDALLIGGAVAAGVGFGIYELTRENKPKDTVAPVAPTTLDLATDDDTGSSNSDNITNKASGLTITGTAEPGSMVELFNGTTSLGTVTANAQGAFTKDIDLAAGQHNIAARATDLAGNVSTASTALRITVDTTAPVAPSSLDLDAADDTGPSNTDNVTGKTSGLTITGTAEAGSTVELFDGTTSLGTVVAGSNGAFSKDISLATGVHAITAKATDTAGNASDASAALTITVDGTPPPAPGLLNLAAEDDSGISNTDNITNKTSGLTLSGTAEAGSTVQLFAGTASLGTVVADANGNFSLDVVSLGVGTYAITARATDVDGNVGPVSAALNITIDNIAPGAPAGLDLAAADDNGASSTDNITSQTSGLTISGNAEAGSTVELFNGSTSLGTAVADANGVFTTDISLAIGTHQITAKATDVAGNIGVASASLEITIVAASQSQALAETLPSDHLYSSALDHTALFDSSSSFG